MNDKAEYFHIVVIGGGMVGAAAALGLAQAGWTVALVESQLAAGFIPTDPPAVRISAISISSVALLEQLGCWQAMKAMRTTPYRGLQTWEWDESTVSFSAADLGLPELGFMVENQIVQLALWQQLQSTAGVTLLAPETLTSMVREDKNNEGNGWQVKLSSGRCLSTSLVIGADGAESRVRQFAGIGITGWEYRQRCLLATVKMPQPAGDITWQRFYPSGPRAFLPLHDTFASLVWYDHPQRIQQLTAMSAVALQAEIMREFPLRLGPVEVLSSASFPLVRRHAQHYVAEGIALLGDAAHTINPLAGQGVNLGYKDVDALLDVLIAARKKGENPFSVKVLQRYERRRYADNLLMQTGMDLFYKAFSNTHKPVNLLRNLVLMATERSTTLKQRVLKYAIGL